MRSELPKPKRSMATRLLRVVFGFYVVVVICLMIGQMIVEYKHQKNSIRREFVSIQNSFEHVLAGELWDLDEKALCATVEGMINLPVVVGMKIRDENGKTIVVGGLIKNGNGAGEVGMHVRLSGNTLEDEKVHSGEAYSLEMFEGDFPIIYPVNHEQRVLGWATIYSNTSVVWDRVKVGLLMLGVKTIIEIALLWLMFNLLFIRMLKRPLAELTTAVERVTLDNLDAIKVSGHSDCRDELGILADSFNRMLLNLQLEITEHKQSEEALRESEERFCHFMDRFPGLAYIKDGDGRMLFANKGFATFLGLEWQNIRGKMTRELFPSDFAKQIDEDDQLTLVRGTGREIEETFNDRYWMTHKFPIVIANAVPLLGGITLDITERKLAEAALRASLEEKDALLKEVHHRVKNNLQIICSLLNLQAVRTQNTEALDILQEAKNRVHSMALLHETLYRSGNLTRVDFAGYIKKICAHVFRSHGTKADSIQLEHRLAAISLGLDHAVPCGLLINELVSNALKHAFPEGRSGRITVGLEKRPDGFLVVTVADTGVGLPPGLDLHQTQTLGHQLVYLLARQLGGGVEVERDVGTLFRIAFPAKLPDNQDQL